MSKKISPIPKGYHTATPCLTVDGVESAIAFYQAAFSASELTRQTNADGTVVLHATIKIGNSTIALNQASAERGVFSPAYIGAATGQIHLYIDDVDVAWAQALGAGALEHTPLFDAYWGDRTGVLADPNGHLWSIASRVECVSQKEIAERAKSLSDPLVSAEDREEDIAA